MTDADFLNEFEHGGFFYETRLMNFDQLKAQRVIRKLESIDAGSVPPEQRAKLVVAIWQIPLLMYVYQERCLSNGADKAGYNSARTKMHILVNDIINTFAAT